MTKADQVKIECNKLKGVGDTAVAFAACVSVSDADFGYGPCILYRMADGSALLDDGRGYTTVAPGVGNY